MRQDEYSKEIMKIAQEWDSNVLCRSLELEKKTDISYFKVVIPTVLKYLEKYSSKKDNVLDVGCGLGFLTNIISTSVLNVVGIDISLNSIQYAQSKFGKIQFINIGLKEYSENGQYIYDVISAIMFFHNCVDLGDQLKSIRKLLKKGGVFIVMIPHPCFWHKRFNNISYINPNNSYEKAYKVDFKIKNGQKHISKISYYHRTLETYVHFFKLFGFEIIEFEEPKKIDKDQTDILSIVLR